MRLGSQTRLAGHRAGGGERVGEEAPAGQVVQDLGSARAHPGALTRSEDENGGRAGRAHALVLLSGGDGACCSLSGGADASVWLPREDSNLEPVTS